MTLRKAVTSHRQRPVARVLMLLENCAYSADGRVRCEANSLAAAGYHVTIIGPKRRGERWRETFGLVEAYQYPPPPDAGGFLGYVVEYGYSLAATAIVSLWIAIRHGFDIVHAHNPPDFFVLIGGFYRLFGKRFVFDHHDLAPNVYLARFSGSRRRFVHRVLLLFEWLSCRVANHVITTNESYKQLEIDRTGTPANRITVVRNGPEPWHFHSYAATPAARRDARLVIGYVGVMGVQDGVDYLLRALHHLKHEFGRSDWRCVLIGSGDAMDDLQAMAAQLGLHDHLTFTGWVDYEKVPQYLSSTDICVAPDPSTVFNERSTIIKVMEYMAQAKPVVAFDLVENRVTAGDTALYAQPNDETDMARHILRLMDDSALRESMGRAGQHRVAEQFTWEHQEPHLLEAYRRVLPGNAHRQAETATCDDLMEPISPHYEREICVTD